jgi:ABC-type Fe3+ transport system substrate-binding protein
VSDDRSGHCILRAAVTIKKGLRSMRISKIICAAVVLAFAMVLVQSASAQDGDWQKVVAAGKKEGIVVAASSSLSGKAAVSVMNVFKDKFGIQLELFTGRMAVAQEKIQMEQKSKSYVTDAMDSGGMNVLLLKKSGYLESVARVLPVLREKDKFPHAIAEDPEAEMLNILEIYTFVCVNTNLVKPGEEPKSWQDLLDPKWKGKIFLTNPQYTTAPEEQLLAFTRGKGGLDENFFVKLYRNAQIGGTGGGDEAMDKLVRGEVAIAGFFPGATALKPMRNGAPVKPLDLKEGHMSKPMKWGLIKNAPHPNATKVYINWFLSKEGQTLVTKETDLESVRNDVPSQMPVSLKGPTVRLSFQDLSLAEEHREKNYMATLLGLKR